MHIHSRVSSESRHCTGQTRKKTKQKNSFKASFWIQNSDEPRVAKIRSTIHSHFCSKPSWSTWPQMKDKGKHNTPWEACASWRHNAPVAALYNLVTCQLMFFTKPIWHLGTYLSKNTDQNLLLWSLFLFTNHTLYCFQHMECDHPATFMDFSFHFVVGSWQVTQ